MPLDVVEVRNREPHRQCGGISEDEVAHSQRAELGTNPSDRETSEEWGFERPLEDLRISDNRMTNLRGEYHHAYNGPNDQRDQRARFV